MAVCKWVAWTHSGHGCLWLGSSTPSLVHSQAGDLEDLSQVLRWPGVQ